MSDAMFYAKCIYSIYNKTKLYSISYKSLVVPS